MEILILFNKVQLGCIKLHSMEEHSKVLRKLHINSIEFIYNYMMIFHPYVSQLLVKELYKMQLIKKSNNRQGTDVLGLPD